MSKARNLAVCALLLISSACAAWPLYAETIHDGSAHPRRTFWSGGALAPRGYGVVVLVPEFWAFSAFSVSAAAWVFVGRRRVALLFLSGSLIGYAAMALVGHTLLRGANLVKVLNFLGRVEHGPTLAFYVAAFTTALATAILLFTPKERNRVDPA